ncbi:MAG: uracil-DNA glycosylase family protein [Alistipes sp.]|nr:uracil-DNA glycosylase family protein [Alistipes sp.]
MANYQNNTERHPLKPFLPKGARILILGSFPPKIERWSMEWFYPNWINDMWRIVGYIFFADKRYFEVKADRSFNKNRIIDFCTNRGIALYDTASEIRRLKDNASDKFLEIVVPTNICQLLSDIIDCKAVITTGQKAAEEVAKQFCCPIPQVGEFIEVTVLNRTIRFWRMPSTSRAYPLSIEKKAEFYHRMFLSEAILER